jgi:hypothetical protein
MVAWKGRRFGLGARYAFVSSIAVLLALSCWAMLQWRTAIEPTVRFVHVGLSLRWPALGRYETNDYYLYAALPGALSVVGLVVTVWGLSTRRETDAKVDAFLASRMPRHEVAIGADRSSVEDR